MKVGNPTITDLPTREFHNTGENWFVNLPIRHFNSADNLVFISTFGKPHNVFVYALFRYLHAEKSCLLKVAYSQSPVSIFSGYLTCIESFIYLN